MKIHHKIGALIIHAHKLLMCRKKGEPHFILPGGRVEGTETPRQTLERELSEETGTNLIGEVRFFEQYEARHFRDEDTLVRMATYFAEIEGEPKPRGEIAEIKWIGSSYQRDGLRLASINADHTIPDLLKLNLID